MSAGAVAVDAGDLPLGGGLLALLRPALEALAPGGVVAVRSTEAGVAHDLPSWCRSERHEYLRGEAQADGSVVHFVARGRFGVTRVVGDEGDAASGFAPRGARVEPGGPRHPFALGDAARLPPAQVTRQLYEQAVQAQWRADELPWQKSRALEPRLENAVAQVMTFLAENELSALYVPARFVSRVHPAFADVAQFLATQMMDESRHIDVFLRRARLHGAALGTSSVTTSRSLLSLLDVDDFTEAAFLLSLLGEGTFLDLLRFVEEHAPDELTAELARRTRADESRHVHFGSVHVRHALAADAGQARRLEDAVRRRAATLHGAGGVPAPIADALTLLAAGDDAPAAVARGHAQFRALLETMHEGRRKRLVHAGFSDEQAQRLSELHTPNFM